MAKLFIGYGQLQFEYNNTPYKGVLTKIVLEEKTIFRVDYTSQKDFQTNRIELEQITGPYNNSQKWELDKCDDKNLAQVLIAHLEKHPQVFEME